MADKNELGITGERLAQRYLIDNGYTILHCNWRYGHKEIDIIAVKNNTLHIIEVKTRSINSWEEPCAAVIRRKQAHLIAAADAYAQEYDIDSEIQFDIIAITVNRGDFSLEYIANAFAPSEL